MKYSLLVTNGGTEEQEAPRGRAVTGGTSSYQCKALSALVVGKPTYVHSLWIELGFSSPSICSSDSLSSQRGLSPLHRTPGLACPATAQPTHSLGQGSAHRDLLFLSDLPPGAQVLTPVPFSCTALLSGDLFWNFGCTEFFWWFLLVFCENCSMCRHIFDVLVGRSEFYVLLLCHLDPSWTEFLSGKEKAFLEEGMSWVKAEARIAKFIFS